MFSDRNYNTANDSRSNGDMSVRGDAGRRSNHQLRLRSTADTTASRKSEAVDPKGSSSSSSSNRVGSLAAGWPPRDSATNSQSRTAEAGGSVVRQRRLVRQGNEVDEFGNEARVRVEITTPQSASLGSGNRWIYSSPSPSKEIRNSLTSHAGHNIEPTRFEFGNSDTRKAVAEKWRSLASGVSQSGRNPSGNNRQSNRLSQPVYTTVVQLSDVGINNRGANRHSVNSTRVESVGQRKRPAARTEQLSSASSTPPSSLDSNRLSLQYQLPIVNGVTDQRWSTRVDRSKSESDRLLFKASERAPADSGHTQSNNIRATSRLSSATHSAFDDEQDRPTVSKRPSRFPLSDASTGVNKPHSHSESVLERPRSRSGTSSGVSSLASFAGDWKSVDGSWLVKSSEKPNTSSRTAPVQLTPFEFGGVKKHNRQPQPPVIIIKPRRQFVEQGTTAKFRVSFEGHPQPTVAWQRRGAELHPCNKYEIYESNGLHILEIRQADELDQDTYQCVVSNELGSVLCQAELAVFGSLKIPTSQQPSAMDGERCVVMTSIAVQSPPTSTFSTTRKQHVRLTSSDSPTSVTSSIRLSTATADPVSPPTRSSFPVTSLRISHAAKGATDPSKAIINGAEKSPPSSQSPPVFDRKLKSVNAAEGEIAELTYSVRGTPEIGIRWEKDGKPFTLTDERFTNHQSDDGSCSLVIDPVLASDAGRYVCVASNDAGETRCMCSVMVAPARSQPNSKPVGTNYRAELSKNAPDSNKRQNLVSRLWNVQPDVQTSNIQISNGLRNNPPARQPPSRGEVNPSDISSSSTLTVEVTKRTSSSFADVDMKSRVATPHQRTEVSDEVQMKSRDVTNAGRKSLTLESTVSSVELESQVTSSTTVNREKIARNSSKEYQTMPSDDSQHLHRKSNEEDEVKNANATENRRQSNAVTTVVFVSNRQQKADDLSASTLNASSAEVSDDNKRQRELNIVFSSAVENSTTSGDGRDVTPMTSMPAVTPSDVKPSSIGKRDDSGLERASYRSQISLKSKFGESLLSADRPVSVGSSSPAVVLDKIDLHPERSASVTAKYVTRGQNASVNIDDDSASRQSIDEESPADVAGSTNKTEFQTDTPSTLQGDDVTRSTFTPGNNVSTDELSSAVSDSADNYNDDSAVDVMQSRNSVIESSDTLDIEDELNEEMTSTLADESRPNKVKVVDGLDAPPFIDDLVPENVHILRGTTLQLVAQFSGSPLPTITWFRDNEKLVTDDRTSMTVEPSGDRAVLTILRTEPSDTGRYAIELLNEHGKDRMFSSVTIEDRPEPPVGKPAVTSVTRSSVVLSWSGCSYDGGSPVIGYRVEQLVVSSEHECWQTITDCCEHTTLVVHNLKPNTEYRFRVSSANKHGFSAASEPSEPIITLETKPSLKFAEHECHNTPTERSMSFKGKEQSPQMLLGPLSPETLLAIRGELPFEPREVQIVPGRKFEDFYIRGEEIGRGKFGNVSKCVDKSSGSTYAAKFIRVKAGQREEFRREVAVMNELRHPKVLLLWDAFESARELIIVMEHVGGRELMERITSDDYELTERECVHFVRQLCEGVAYIHSRLILHLDLKPENVLCVTLNSNEIKIIDFGLARNFDPTKSVKVMFGTAEFVAPEVINYDDIGFSTDMWSIGVICYLLLSGWSPFAGDDEAETLSNITRAQYDYDVPEFDEITSTAKDFIDKLLVKSPKKRMQAEECLKHSWLSQDISYMRAKRLSTSKHKRFLARRKWMKTGNALKALTRLTGLQRLSASGGLSTKSSSVATSSSGRSSVASDVGPSTSKLSTTSGSRRLPDVLTMKSRSLDLKASGVIQLSQPDETGSHARESEDVVVTDHRRDSGVASTTAQTPVDDDSRSSLSRSLDILGCTNADDSENSTNASQRNNENNDVSQTVNDDVTEADVTTPKAASKTDQPKVLNAADATCICQVDSVRSSPSAQQPSELTVRSPSVENGSSSAPSKMSYQCITLQPAANLSVSSSSKSPSADRDVTTPGKIPPSTGVRSLAAVRKNFESATNVVPPKISQPSSAVTVGRTGDVTERRRIADVGFLSASSSGTPLSSKPKQAPSFVRKMRNVKVVEGDTARFDVLVAANPVPTVVWMKDGTDIDTNALDRKFTSECSIEEGRWTLFVSDCGEDDDAEYGCRAANNLGQVASKAQLYVEPAGAGEE